MVKRSFAKPRVRAAAKTAAAAMFCAAALLGRARPASACVPALVIFHSPSSAQTLDGTAPSVPVVTLTEVYRRKGERCSGGECVSNSCGDSTTVRIEFEGGLDDQTPPEEVGYGIEVLSGTVPGAPEDLRPRVESSGSLYLNHIAFDELPSLDAEVRLIAVDNAGNQSESEPFRLEYTGCTKSPVGEDCMDPEDGALGCSLRAPGAASGVSMWLALLLPLVGRAHRRAHERVRR